MGLVSGGPGSSAAVWIPILAALVTAFAAVITVYLSRRANLQLEREKFQTNAQMEREKFDATSKLEREKFEATEKLERQKFDANEKLERQKFESSLVLQAIATNSRVRARKNLEFLVEAGFLPDPKGQIKALKDNPEKTPVLSARSADREWWSVPIQPGKFRWGVRTGSDADASLVKVTPVKATVEELVGQPRPAGMESGTGSFPAYQNHRAEGAERTVYEVEADLVGCKLETSGNFHLNLQGKTGQTMIAICPDPDPQFVDPSSRWAKQIGRVRKQIQERLEPERNKKKVVNERVRITGVGFFNTLHGQWGLAPNGLELSPVLSIEWLSQP